LVKLVKHLLFVIKSISIKINSHFFASVFRKGDIEKSTNYLTKYLEKVSHKEGDIQYARACSALGFIHNTLVRCQENFFFSIILFLFL
jgi:hypothetical protein